MSAPAPIIRDFKPLDRNSLKGFFDLELPSGLVLCGCQLHQSHGQFWVGMPARPYAKPDGSQSWVKIVDFRDHETRDRFQEIVKPLALEAFERAKAEVAA